MAEARVERRPWIIVVAVVVISAALIAVASMLGGSGPDEAAAPATGADTDATGTDPASADAEAAPDTDAVADPANDAPSDSDSDPAANDPAGDPGQQEPPTFDLERRDPNDPLTAGPVDAPVAMVVFSDFQCPYCAAWAADSLPVIKEYVDAGDLRLEWRDLNILGDASERAALASYAAGLQDEFWTYSEALFADGEPRPAAELTEDGLIELAVDLGLDGEQFAADMAAPATLEAVHLNAGEGLAIGVLSTPAFLIDGQPMIGAQPPEAFVEVIEAALAGQR